MGNGEEQVKRIADYVTTDIDADGIFNACKHYKLIQRNRNGKYQLLFLIFISPKVGQIKKFKLKSKKFKKVIDI